MHMHIMRRACYWLTALGALAALAMALLPFAFPLRASAQATPPPAATPVPAAAVGPVHVKVGVYVLNVGRLDTATGAFTIDFYLAMTCDRACSPGNFEFSNGRATSIDRSVDDPTEKFYRVQASLTSSLNLSRYPFDRHKLIIELEDKDQTDQTLVYEVSLEDTGLDPAV